jgi:hypothetical protein
MPAAKSLQAHWLRGLVLAMLLMPSLGLAEAPVAPSEIAAYTSLLVRQSPTATDAPNVVPGLRTDIALTSEHRVRLDLGGSWSEIWRLQYATAHASWQGDWQYFGAGAGVGAHLFNHGPQFLVLPTLQLRLGPEWLHGFVRLFDFGSYGGVRDALTGGFEIGRLGRVLGARLLDPLALAVTVGKDFDNHTFLEGGAAVRFRWGNIRIAFRHDLGPTAADTPDYYAFGDWLTFGVGVNLGEPPRRPYADKAPTEKWTKPPVLDTRTILTPGRTFTLRQGPLRVRSDVPVPVPQTTTCTVDEEWVAGGTTWHHMTCAPDLPADSPTPWRTGCYATTAQGVWRLPFCPSDDASPGRYPHLVVQADAQEPSSRFILMAAQGPTRRTFRVGDQDVPTQCMVVTVDEEVETCAADNWGVVWSAYRWHTRIAEKPEVAVVLLAVTDAGSMTTAHPHLQFRRPESAVCEMSPACTVLGACKIQGKGCITGSDADCANSRICARDGRCKARAGVCAAERAEDCQASTLCSAEGRCTPVDGRCTAKGDDCLNADACVHDGRCSLRQGRCVETASPVEIMPGP